MDLASAGILANWRPDELAHMSRFDKIASLCIDEAKRLGRPLNTFEVGCGECWALRCIYNAYVIKNNDTVVKILKKQNIIVKIYLKEKQTRKVIQV